MNLPALDAWMDATLPPVGVGGGAAVISAEFYLYGGLITSRCSNDTTDAVLARLATLLSFKRTYPALALYVSSVVMRIPSYNEAVEEPWYWAYYGADLYTFSYYTDKYASSGDPADAARAAAARALVPPGIVTEFIWRRARNYNVSVAMVEAAAAEPGLFDALYITLDDNAAYGFNIAEAARLRALVAARGLGRIVRIYPGADEVGLTMLARLAADTAGRTVHLNALFRDPATVDLVPNYEGQPMNETLYDQVAAAGGAIVPSGGGDADAALLVNNFEHAPQTEAPEQPIDDGEEWEEVDVDEFGMLALSCHLLVDCCGRQPH